MRPEVTKMVSLERQRLHPRLQFRIFEGDFVGFDGGASCRSDENNGRAVAVVPCRICPGQFCKAEICQDFARSRSRSPCSTGDSIARVIQKKRKETRFSSHGFSTSGFGLQ